MNAASSHRTFWKTIARCCAVLSAVTLFGGYVYLSQRTPSPQGLPREPGEQAAVPVPAERTVAPSSKLSILATVKLVREPSHEDATWPPRDDKDSRIPPPVTTIVELPPLAPQPTPRVRAVMPGSKSDDMNFIPRFLGVLSTSDGTELERLRHEISHPRPAPPALMPGSKRGQVDGEWMVAELLRKMLGVKPETSIDEKKPSAPALAPSK